jgi:hypothetical protein
MNPILLTIPVFIAAVLTIACGVLFSIIHRKDEEIDNLIKNLLTLNERHEEIVDKLEYDLKQSDEAYDLLVKDNANHTIEIAYLKGVIASLKIQLNQANARTFTGRKRNNKGQFVTVAKDVEP